MGRENISYSKEYKELIPYREYGLFDVAWHDGMFAGNGHIGVIESGAPLNDNLDRKSTRLNSSHPSSSRMPSSA